MGTELLASNDFTVITGRATHTRWRERDQRSIFAALRRELRVTVGQELVTRDAGRFQV